MRLKWNILVLFLLFMTTARSLHAQERTVGLTFNSPVAYDGYTLFTSLQNRGIYLIDNCGKVVNQWKDDKTAANAVYLLEDGHLLRTAKSAFVDTDVRIGGGGESVQKLDWDGNVVWEFRYVNDSIRLHHDVEVLPNGNILMLAWEKRTDTVAIAAGRNPNLLSQDAIFPEHLIEVKPIGTDSGEIVWEWHMWDHLVQEFDASRPNYGAVSEHPELFDLNFINTYVSGGDARDWVHANAVAYNPELDQIALSFQRWSEIYIIDHSTTTAEAASHTGGRYGKGGDILYRWGNSFAMKLGGTASQRCWGQHDVKWIPPNAPGAGKLILFNNGNWRTPAYSEVLILDPPQSEPGVYTRESGEPFGPVEPEVVYGSENNGTFSSYFISGAQRLANGNTLICQGEIGRLFEVNVDGQVVWEYLNPQGTENRSDIIAQGDTAVLLSLYRENSTFRAERYPVNFAGFEGKDLTSGEPIEVDPWDYVCEYFPAEVAQVFLYPNPARESVSLMLENAEIALLTFGVFDSQGRRVYSGTLEEQGAQIDLSLWNSGIYFVRISNGTCRRLLLQKNTDE